MCFKVRATGDQQAAKTDMLAGVKQWMLSDVAWHPSVSNSCISSETVSPEQRFVHMTLCLPGCETRAYRLRRVSPPSPRSCRLLRDCESRHPSGYPGQRSSTTR